MPTTSSNWDFMLPQAGEETLGQVLPSISSHLLGRGQQAPLELPPAKTYCVVLVDGLGFHNLLHARDHAPFLTAHLRKPIVNAVPTTTATNLTFFGTGATGGQTRMLGYTVQNPVSKQIANLISWNGAPEPELWQPIPTVFEKLAQEGITSVSVGPWRFEGSGLTRAGLRGAEYESAEELSDRIELAAEVAHEDVGAVYLYWGEVDAIGHHYGPHTQTWNQELRRIDAALQQLRGMLPKEVPLIVTADHGMVPIPDEDSKVFPGPARFDIAAHNSLAQAITNLAGEPRFLHVHTEPGAARHVAQRWQEFFLNRATIWQRDEAIAAGLFGEIPSKNHRIIGDVVVAMQGDLAVGDSRFQRPATLLLPGMHGSLTALERQVPLIVA